MQEQKKITEIKSFNFNFNLKNVLIVYLNAMNIMHQHRLMNVSGKGMAVGG